MKKNTASADELPNGFQLVGPQNIAKLQEWVAKAKNDSSVRRFLSGVGWTDIGSTAPATDWERVIAVNDKTLVMLSFDRSPLMEISIALFTLGENKQMQSGLAIICIAKLLRRYSYFRRVRSGCKACNRRSAIIHQHLFGKPWGVEPLGVWDEVEGFCDELHFSAPMRDVLRRCDALIKKFSKR